MSAKRKTKVNNSESVASNRKKSKRYLVVVFTIIALLALGSLLKNYVGMLSSQDYSKIYVSGENILHSVNSKSKATKRESCRYSQAGSLNPDRLYCQIDLVAYFNNDEEGLAAEIGKRVESEGLKHFKNVHSFGFSEFYDHPNDSTASLTGNLVELSKESRCTLSIYTGEKAKRAAYFLPERTEDNLIAITFECSGPSREKYFPMLN